MVINSSIFIFNVGIFVIMCVGVYCGIIIIVRIVFIAIFSFFIVFIIIIFANILITINIMFIIIINVTYLFICIICILMFSFDMLFFIYNFVVVI